MMRIDELLTSPVVGESYTVKCVHVTPHANEFHSRWMPVWADPHVDDLVASNGNEKVAGRWHIHLDQRFLTDEEFRSLDSAPGDSPTAFCTKEDPNYQWMLRVMLREWRNNFFSNKDFGQAFDVRYMDEKLDLKCKKCPHQGADLSQVHVHDGLIICPLHRLAWSAKDGSLVPKWTLDVEYYD